MSDLVETVAAAVWSQTVDGWHAQCHPEGFVNRPEHIRENYLKDARFAVDAALEWLSIEADERFEEDGTPDGMNVVYSFAELAEWIRSQAKEELS